MKTFKVLSALLNYPTVELSAAASDMMAVLKHESLLPEREQAALKYLIDDIANDDLFDLQERYVLLFDRTRSLSLHMFEHVHGQSRDRGQAMIDLKALYERAGLLLQTNELPDYLPLFLEFLSTRELQDACDLLGQTVHIQIALGERLKKRHSPYEAVFLALVALARTKPTAADLAAVTADSDEDPTDFAALDAIWQEEEVRFGPASQGTVGDCSKEGLVARMRHAKRAVDTTDNPLN